MLEAVDVQIRQRDTFLHDVLTGLSGQPKSLPSRWLYDDRGCELFEDITALEEYYPTRTETAILRSHAADMAAFCGAGPVLLEYGAGAAVKTEILMAALEAPKLYVPIDIAADFLTLTARRFSARFPGVAVRPVAADFTHDFDLPSGVPTEGRVVFFPGSTIGNLDEPETAAFLSRIRRHTGSAGKALIGVDLKKDLDLLHAAYDDREGVTAAFNLNILARINRELGGNFTLDAYAHQARWNEKASAVEMHLVSRQEQEAKVAGRTFHFAPGETIHTESSRKYEPAVFSQIARRHGWRVETVWTDPARLFAVFGLRSIA
ncbi:dimethylhistidine N-methyltransferase [Agaricicola taiwanensis]|uniref:Dimethylhistidine N-methyltransferase n=1 Tax=Agaricicola taiwanensis TaxID=591372 RepID=A0A8J2YF54_9RHOB|nr:L-histidine N(alpha)-methyltransferase [Agaricicola taiwanensis]GGE28464.1 dimethylhistidine N-methyltransferase [Agaricicola taiwanensis]